MADASFRYQQQSGPSSFYYNQQTHHPRHLARNGSPVNSSRGAFSNDTPSPSRSPVSQASSHLPYNMYGQGQLQGHGMMMNGGGPQRYQNVGMGHKFQHQNHHHQHHGQQNHHHQSNNAGTIGHQHTFSSGTMSNATPHYTNNVNHGNYADDHLEMDEHSSHHWQQQVQLAEESRRGAPHPHRHCKRPEAVRLLDRGADEASDEAKNDESKEERNRASVTDVIRRQDWDALDFSGQGMRTISPPVFQQFIFMRRLYLDHNRLDRLDPSLGRLRLLSILDVSGNQITEVPREIGMLVNLKILNMFDNRLSILPPEMGHLYRLEFLGIEGNPMDRDITQLFQEKGTKDFIAVLRNTYLDTPEPPPREWLEFEHTDASETLSVLSYNILCDKYATTSQYGYTPAKALAWDGRRQLVLDEIAAQNSDVICLQEVDRESFQDYFQYHLAKEGYRGIFYPKSRAKTMAEKEAKLVDGCAIFYKAKDYICLDKMVVDFGSTAINRSDMKGEHDIFNRVMPRDNISVVAFLENRWTGARTMIGNAHIYWDPKYADVKLVQVAILMEQIAKKAEEWATRPPCTDKAAFRFSEDDVTADGRPDASPEPGPSLEYANGSQIPLILCGDFNSAVGTGVYDLITLGELPSTHEDLTSRNYGSFTREGMYHPFKLKSAYDTMGELKFTNYTPNFTGVIDYIWYSSNAMEVKGLLGNVDEDYLRRVPGFPNKHFPSDHLALKAEFAIKTLRPSKLKDSELVGRRK